MKERWSALSTMGKVGVVIGALFVCGVIGVLFGPDDDAEAPDAEPVAEEAAAPEQEADEPGAEDEAPTELVEEEGEEADEPPTARPERAGGSEIRNGFTIATPEEFAAMAAAGEALMASDADTWRCMMPRPGHADSVARALEGESYTGPVARFDTTELGSVPMAVVFEDGSLGATYCFPDDDCKSWDNPEWQTLESPITLAACAARLVAGETIEAAP